MFHHNHIYVTVPSEHAPALPFQSRRRLSASRTVNLPHYHILLPPGTIYLIYIARIFPQPYSAFHCPYALQSMNFSPDPRQASDTQLCNLGLRSNCFTFQPTKPQWQDASSSSSPSSLKFLGRVLGRRLCSCSNCPSSRPGVRIPRLWNWQIRC